LLAEKNVAKSFDLKKYTKVIVLGVVVTVLLVVFIVILYRKIEDIGNLPVSQQVNQYIVNLESDESDADISDMVCDIDTKTKNQHECTLRAAIEQANSNKLSDKITFSGEVSVIQLTAPLPKIINEVEGKDIVIEGQINNSGELDPDMIVIRGVGSI